MRMTSYGESIAVVNMCCSPTYWHRVVSRCLKRRTFFLCFFFSFCGVETCDSTCVSFLQIGLFDDSALGNHMSMHFLWILNSKLTDPSYGSSETKNVFCTFTP